MRTFPPPSLEMLPGGHRSGAEQVNTSAAMVLDVRYLRWRRTDLGERRVKWYKAGKRLNPLWPVH